MTENQQPPKIESLRDRTKRFVGEILADWIKLPLAQVGEWAKRRVAQFVIGLVLLSVAIVFLLIGGVQGLQELKVPPWATYLGAGVVAGLAGVIALMRK